MIKGNFKNLNIHEQTVVTIGNFDGVHLGHRLLMEQTKKLAVKECLKSAALTFLPHPREFFEHKDFLLITTKYEKDMILKKLLIDYRIFMEFNDELSQLQPIEFIEQILVKALKCRYVIVGENFTFGKGKEGDVKSLKSLCKPYGIEVEFFPSVMQGGKTVSSERIRGLLASGNITGANALLGEPYFTYGEVVRGKSLGKTLGFPTINLDIEKNKLLPKYGVFFTQTAIDGCLYNGITNVGIRPTVGGGDKTVETFLFDFDGDVYGKQAIVRFLHRQRDEAEFDSIKSLKEAIKKDKQAALEFFGKRVKDYE